jgi:hypothetical protein
LLGTGFTVLGALPNQLTNFTTLTVIVDGVQKTGNDLSTSTPGTPHVAYASMTDLESRMHNVVLKPGSGLFIVRIFPFFVEPDLALALLIFSQLDYVEVQSSQADESGRSSQSGNTSPSDPPLENSPTHQSSQVLNSSEPTEPSQSQSSLISRCVSASFYALEWIN